MHVVSMIFKQHEKCMYMFCMYILNAYRPDPRSGFSNVNLFIAIQRVRLSQPVAVVSTKQIKYLMNTCICI